MSFDIIFARKSMLAETYGGYLLKESCPESELFLTENITEFTPEMLTTIKDKNILIIGGYYRENIKEITRSATMTTVFYNSSDFPEFLKNGSPSYSIIIGTEHRGFLSWVIRYLHIKEDYIRLMGRYLDEYLYGYPSEESLRFQQGVYSIQRETDLEKILTIKSVADVEDAIEVGSIKRFSNLRHAKQRLTTAYVYPIRYDGRLISATVSIGDSPIVDTCILLAEHTGVGILFRYDLRNNKTFVSCRTTEKSDIDAGKLMKQFIGGGGSYVMGGGSVDGLKFPHELFVQDE